MATLAESFLADLEDLSEEEEEELPQKQDGEDVQVREAATMSCYKLATFASICCKGEVSDRRGETGPRLLL